MRSRISENEALKKAFQHAYLAKESAVSGETWRSQIMRRVRKIGPLESSAGFWPAFEHLVWSLVPVICLLIVALTALLLSLDLDLGHDYLGTVTAELEKPTLSELFRFGS
jgi:hypothetical protein